MPILDLWLPWFSSPQMFFCKVELIKRHLTANFECDALLSTANGVFSHVCGSRRKFLNDRWKSLTGMHSFCGILGTEFSELNLNLTTLLEMPRSAEIEITDRGLSRMTIVPTTSWNSCISCFFCFSVWLRRSRLNIGRYVSWRLALSSRQARISSRLSTGSHWRSLSMRHMVAAKMKREQIFSKAVGFCCLQASQQIMSVPSRFELVGALEIIICRVQWHLPVTHGEWDSCSPDWPFLKTQDGSATLAYSSRRLESVPLSALEAVASIEELPVYHSPIHTSLEHQLRSPIFGLHASFWIEVMVQVEACWIVVWALSSQWQGHPRLLFELKESVQEVWSWVVASML